MIASRTVKPHHGSHAGLDTHVSSPRSSALRMLAVRGAFTLVELVMILLIVGIIAAIAMPRLATGQSRYLVDSAARRIAADLDRARTQAVASSRSVSVVFRAAESVYSIAGLEALDRRTANTVVQISQEPYKARIVQVNFNGSATLTWDGFGTASASGSITVAVGTDHRLITIDQSTSVITIQTATASAETGTNPGGTGTAPGGDGTPGGIRGIILDLLPGLLLPVDCDGGVW